MEKYEKGNSDGIAATQDPKIPGSIPAWIQCGFASKYRTCYLTTVHSGFQPRKRNQIDKALKPI